MVKLGECLLKSSFLVSLTRLVSWLNASEWLHVSTLYQGRISCNLELGGPSEVALDMVLPRGMSSTGSGEGCCLLGLEECSGAGEEGATGADGCSMGRLLVIRWMGGTWVPVPSICDRKLPVHLWALQGWLVRQLDRQRGSQSDSYFPLGWPVPPGVGWSWHVSGGVSQTGRLPGSPHPW